MTLQASENVWITGGGSGIGEAVALAYAARGAQVWISGRDSSKLNAVVAKAKGLMGCIQALELDVTDAKSIEAGLAQLWQEAGQLDRVVLCAGNHIEMPADQFSHDTCQSLIEVNYFGITRVLDKLIPEMLRREQGQIALVASLAGYRGLPLAAAYGGSKAAVIALAESLRSELDKSPLDIRLINPGFVRSPLTDKNQFEMPFLMESEAAGAAIVEGLDSSRFEIRFPRPFTWMLKLLSMLPYSLYFPLIRRITKQ